MMQDYDAVHVLDNDGNPAGGTSIAVGVHIAWQRGALGRGDDRQEPNGAFVETVIQIAADRLNFYQEGADGRFACAENAAAILCLKMAIDTLNRRTQRRENEGVEGTHDGN